MLKKVLIAGQEGMVAVYMIYLKKNLKLSTVKEKILILRLKNKLTNGLKKIDLISLLMLLVVWEVLDNYKFQSDYLYINTMIGMNIVNSSFKYKVKKLINLGSSCIYPRKVKQPISENSLSSNLEKTNEGYALSKIVT